jgi:hypothetical protein
MGMKGMPKFLAAGAPPAESLNDSMLLRTFDGLG